MSVLRISGPTLIVTSSKMTLAVILEHCVSVTNRRHKQVGIAVIIGIRKRGRNADAPQQRHPGLVGDVLKSAFPEIAPQLVPADLVYKIQIDQPVSIDIGGGQTVPVIVVVRHRSPGCIGNRPIHESNSARFNAVGEFKIVEDLQFVRCRQLGRAPRIEPGRVKHVGRVASMEQPRRSRHRRFGKHMTHLLPAV